jgi:mRNA-degrading endonuclease RelE of RelBE toxin-antitoxin system
VDTLEYFVKSHPLLIKQDLPFLPSVLAEDFEFFFKPILEQDPYNCCGEIRNHILDREPLVGYYAMEIKWERIDFRLVYRITESLKRVDVISFDHHKPAYHKAHERVRTSTGYRD